MKTPTLERRAVVRRLLAGRSGLLVVTGLGSSSYDAFAAGDHDLNFYLWGAMGGAAMTGLGLALAQPDRPVMVLTGDGEMLMALGALATIGQHNPGNLSIVVLDNTAYGETGAQASHTVTTDLVGVAAACGIARTERIDDEAGVQALADRLHRPAQGTLFSVVRIASTEVPRAIPIRDSAYVKGRFRLALGLPVDG